MARALNNGWDFVKVGQTYQYKEDSFLANVTIIEDNSDAEYYRFKLRTESCNFSTPPTGAKPCENGEFHISYTKENSGYYSGMLQLYETPEYSYSKKWQRERIVNSELEELRKFLKIAKCDNPIDLAQAVLDCANSEGFIQGRNRQFDAKKMANNIAKYFEEEVSPNVMTREYGIRQQAMYIKYYLEKESE